MPLFSVIYHVCVEAEDLEAAKTKAAKEFSKSELRGHEIKLQEDSPFHCSQCS